MITLQELCDKLDLLLDSSLYKDYCPNGLQVEGKSEVRTVATAVTASVAAIEQAVEAGVDALFVHHGMFWNRDPYVVTGVKKKKLQLLLSHGISLIAYHLPLDAHTTVGNNWKAAKDLGWEQLEAFGLFDGVAIGVRGIFPEMSRDHFQQRLESYYGQEARTALGGNEMVSSVALISGGAYRSIEEASAAGIDCFITGNFDEPAWHLAHEGGVNFYAMGHSATERVGPKAVAAYLESRFDLKVTFLPDGNPF
ncbi:GTP cyclohydrolase 1 type 2 homolog [Chlamydiales bacterium SCGC AG-110-P3]|nr:GTP cyclohydrolase 1 type 2 homolog [Chlamydiales bacterium SCGC AG-110-P3]